MSNGNSVYDACAIARVHNDPDTLRILREAETQQGKKYKAAYDLGYSSRAAMPDYSDQDEIDNWKDGRDEANQDEAMHFAEGRGAYDMDQAGY
jgi:hypothetical protein